MDSEQEVLDRGKQEVDMNWIYQREKNILGTGITIKKARETELRKYEAGWGVVREGSAQGKIEAFTTRSLTVHPDCECQPSYRPSVTFLKMEMAQCIQSMLKSFGTRQVPCVISY